MLKVSEATQAKLEAEGSQRRMDLQDRSQVLALQTSKEMADAVQRELDAKNAAYVRMKTELKAQIDHLQAAHARECAASVPRREYENVNARLQRSTKTVTQLEGDCQQLRAAAQQARSESDFVRKVLKVELMRSEFAY